jgi:hypothetical protein
MPPKRRLPVLQAPPDEGPARPPWQWSLFAAGLIVLSWLLLTALASPLASAILRANIGAWGSPDELTVRLAAASPEALGRISLETVALQTSALLMASLASGVVLGVWGPGRPLVEAAFAGGMVAAGAVLFAVLASRGSGDAGTVGTWGSVVLIPCAAMAASAGAWLGARRKRSLPAV